MAERKRIDVALVEQGFFASRAKAREAIEAGLVFVAGNLVRKPSEEVDASAEISAQAPYRWVSRGGVKLAGALKAFTIDVRGLVCLDLGASTGGFCHVLLEQGVSRIYAVDVGHGQLHPTIAADPRVVSWEKTDARMLKAAMFETPPQLIVCDVSFISLKLVLPHVLPLAASGAQLVALIKPQFEAGRERTSKGIVRDSSLHDEICADIKRFVESLGWSDSSIIPSPIEGGDGNREFLMHAKRGALAV